MIINGIFRFFFFVLFVHTYRTIGSRWRGYGSDKCRHAGGGKKSKWNGEMLRIMCFTMCQVGDSCIIDVIIKLKLNIIIVHVNKLYPLNKKKKLKIKLKLNNKKELDWSRRRFCENFNEFENVWTVILMGIIFLKNNSEFCIILWLVVIYMKRRLS